MIYDPAEEGDPAVTMKSPLEPKKRIRRAEQLVFPFDLRPGDTVLEDGVGLEVVGHPTSLSGGRLIYVRVRRQGGNVESDTTWAAWRKLHVVRRPAA